MSRMHIRSRRFHATYFSCQHAAGSAVAWSIKQTHASQTDANANANARRYLLSRASCLERKPRSHTKGVGAKTGRECWKSELLPESLN